MNKELKVSDNSDLEAMLGSMLADSTLVETIEPQEAEFEAEAVIEVLEVSGGNVLDLSDIQDLEVAEVVEAAALPEDELTDLELSLEIASNYDSQESIVIDSTEPVKTDTKAAAKANKTPKVAKTRTTRAARVAKPGAKTLDDVSPDFFVLTGTVASIAFMEDAEVKAAKVATLAAKPAQIKVVEKFENAILSLAAGKMPCSYTMVAFKLLDAKKTVTVSELVIAYKATAKGGSSTELLGEGTARAQSGQMGALLPALGIATRVGKALQLAPDSTIAERIRALMI